MSVASNWRAVDFSALQRFSRRQAAAWNTARHLFTAGAGWQAWIREGLADLFDAPDGLDIKLRQRHTIDPHQSEAVYSSGTGEITLGRDESCQVRLAPRSVGNRHARIFVQSGRCYIEDLGSTLGTFLNETRLPANQPAPVDSGDQFAIFPYAFTVEIAEKWVRGVDIEVHAGRVVPVRAGALRIAPADQARFALEVQPAGAVFLLEANRSFLERLSTHLLAPLGLGAVARLGLADASAGFFELLAGGVLERANRDLPFPLQVALSPASTAAGLQDEDGLSFSFAVKVWQLTGAFRLVMPDTALALLARLAVPQTLATVLTISWAFPVTAGYVDLNNSEVALIEPGDVVLLNRETAILFPNAPERGWRASPAGGNLSRARVDNYFERNCLSPTGNELKEVFEGEAAPNLASLPVRMHAIIGDKEMTLAEANALVAGSIVELDQSKSEPVRIALNGKIAGTGELVEVEGRLGVRILAWKTQ